MPFTAQKVWIKVISHEIRTTPLIIIKFTQRARTTQIIKFRQHYTREQGLHK